MNNSIEEEDLDSLISRYEVKPDPITGEYPKNKPDLDSEQVKREREIDDLIEQYSVKGFRKSSSTIQDEPKKDLSWGRFLGEQLSKGALDIADLVALMPQLGSILTKQSGMVESLQKAIPSGNQEPYKPDIYIPSEPVKGFLKEKGVDLDSQGEGDTAFQRIVGSGARALPAGGIFGPIGAAIGGAQGATAQGLKEVGVSEPIADVAGAIGPVAAGPLARAGGRSIKSLSPTIQGRKAAEKMLIEEMGGQEGVKQAEHAIRSSYQPYQAERGILASKGVPVDYTPTTPELADNAGLARISDALMDTPMGSVRPEYDLQAIKKQNRKGIEESIERLKGKDETATSDYVQEFLAERNKGYERGEKTARIKAVKEAKREHLDPALEALRGGVSNEEAGAIVRERLTKNLDKGIAERKAQTSELEDAIYKSKETTVPKKTLNVANELLERNSGNTQATQPILKVKNALISQIDSAARKPESYQKAMKVIKEKDPELYKGILEEFGSLKKSDATANFDIKEAIVGALRENDPELINPFLDSLNPSIKNLYNLQKSIGEWGYNAESKTAKAMYSKLNKALEEDLSKFPQVKAYREKYKELSGPVNKIEESRAFRPLFEKEGRFGPKFSVADSEVAARFLKGFKSAEDAKSLYKTLNPKEREVFGKYVGENALTNILDTNGLPSSSKIESFKKSHPGSFVLDPSLNKKLANADNATKFYNDTAAKNYSQTTKEYKAMFKAIDGKNPERVLPDIFRSKNSNELTDELLRNLNKDGSGKALGGARRTILEMMAPTDFTPHKFLKFYDTHRQNVNKFFNTNQVRALELIEKSMRRSEKDMAKMFGGTNSKTHSRIEVAKRLNEGVNFPILDKVINPTVGAIAGSGAGLMGGPASGVAGAAVGAGAGKLFNTYREAARKAYQDQIRRIIASPIEATLFLETVRGKNPPYLGVYYHGKFIQHDTYTGSISKDLIKKARDARIYGYPIVQTANEAKEERE